tara:strand:+ start:939 stop:1232 length:294 start_codon:yes stop_codon:yes gene_type:complete
MKTKTISPDKAKEIIKANKYKFFTAHFIKANNEKRILNCMVGKKYTPKTNKKQPYDPNKYNLLKVYDLKIKDFRIINFNTLYKLNINKTKYKIKQNV